MLPRAVWGSTVLLAYGVVHFAFSRNIYPTANNSLESPYERTFKEGPFVGWRIPFMARIRFVQLKPLADAKETHRMGPNKIWGVFMGWSTAPGGKWTGRYFCAALTEFVGMDLRVGSHVRVQEVSEVYFDEEEIFFPLKDMYDRATGTLEGLSAPHGSVGDVAPQGLKDLGVFEEDTGPVGEELGDDEQAEGLPDKEPEAPMGGDKTPDVHPELDSDYDKSTRHSLALMTLFLQP